MHSSALTPAAYLASLPPDRRVALSALRKVILANLPEGYEEMMGYGMVVYAIPLARYPKTYNGQPLMIAAFASQKNAMSLYLMNVYGDETTQEWFLKEWKKTGKKLDMGKSCIRFKKLEDLALELIGKTVAKTTVATYLKRYEAIRKATAAGK